MSIGGDASAVLPPALLARPSVRRGSVFSDLITIFRRSSSHPNRIFRHLSHSPTNKLTKNERQKTNKFSKPTAYNYEQNQEEESEESGGKPMSRQVLLDKIREKKEVIGKLRCQPWNMNRKRRTLRLAQKYVAQHESRVSKTHLLKVELKKRWGAFCRWADNVKIYLIPWEAKIKRIESHFGSVVSSYFTFLRWIVYVNVIITLIIISFIVIPEMLADAAADPSRVNRTASRKIIPSQELIHADELQVVSNFDGYLKYSPLFYGYYSNDEFVGARIRYAVPLAYFIITLFVFGYSCFAILRKMAMNARLSKMSDKKTDQYLFSWKLFGGWDYTIGNSETASNTTMAIVIKLRESIMECRVNSEKKFKPLIFLARVIANAIILAMLAFSIYMISVAVQTSETLEKTGNLLTKNQVPTIIATITNVFPMIFDLIGQIERYHPRTALRVHLARVLVLYVLNYITFIIALFEKLDKIRDDELMKIINEQNAIYFHGEQYPTSIKFHSRNFANIMQANMFAETSLERFSNLYQKSSQIHEEIRQKRKTLNTTKPSFRFPGGITVESHYGPVGLNNPSALLANKSYPWDQGRFQAIRIGPPSLPTFPIQPLPPNPALNTSILTELGPHWRSQSKSQHPKTMIFTTAATKNQILTQNLSKIIRKTTRIPWSSRRRPKPSKILKISSKDFDGMRTDKISADITKRNNSIIATPAISEKVNTTLPSQTIASTFTVPNSNTNSNTTLIVDEDQMTEGISERKTNESRKLIVKDGYFKAPNNETIYQVGTEALIINDEAEVGNNFCWETMIGQEIAKLVTMDLVITIASIFIIDFFRDLWIKYCNSWWCWNMETIFPEYGEFKVAENVLHIINNQGMVWLGLFFAPLLPALNNLKLIILMYIRGWACMTCNVPAREIFRASRSSNFYLMVLLLWLLLCTLPVGYVIASKKPSSSCGPFAGYARFYNVLTQMLEGRLDRKVINWLRYIASPGVVIPVLLLLMLIIYFLVSLVRGLRKTNNDLQQQLIHERTEEKKKIFELVGTAQKKGLRNNREKKKQMITYLPLVEQKRREPWGFYNGQDHNSSLCVTDETNSMTSPDSGQSLSPKNLRTGQLLPQSTIQQESVRVLEPVQQQIIRENMNDQNASENEIELKGLLPQSSTDQANEWLKHDNDDGDDKSEVQSYNVESDVIEEATSEEVRLVDSSLFNKSSLIQLSQHEPKTEKAASSLTQSHLLPIHQSQCISEIHIPTSQLHFPPTISKDESAANQPTFSGEPQISLIADTQTKKSKTSSRSRTSSIKHEFVPRPSVKDAQCQVSEFSQRQQKSKADSGNNQPSKSISSHQSCKKTENFEETSSASKQHHQRRFRISVSPSRRLQNQSGPSGSDTDTSTGKRRYVIRQEILPDSTTSVNMGDDSGASHRKSSIHSYVRDR
ncbi:TMC domain family protein [Acanthocheilonema viteae]